MEFLFDFGSPNAFLRHRVIPEIEARAGARFIPVPILLGGVFKATGNLAPGQALAGVPAKLACQRRDMERFIEDHGIDDHRRNPHFPVNTLALMRGCFAAKRLGVFEACTDACHRAMRVDGLKMDEPDVILAALNDAGLDGAALMALAQAPEVKAELVSATAAAVERGCFGSPTFFVGDEMWFGKERLGDVVAAALAA